MTSKSKPEPWSCFVPGGPTNDGRPAASTSPSPRKPVAVRDSPWPESLATQRSTRPLHERPPLSRQRTTLFSARGLRRRSVIDRIGRELDRCDVVVAWLALGADGGALSSFAASNAAQSGYIIRRVGRGSA
jgi:hypothetical protein